MVEKGRREGHKDQKARERREQEEDDREGQKRRERTRGLLGGMSKKKPDEVCLQLARSHSSPPLKGISCRWAIMYLDMLGGGTKHS